MGLASICKTERPLCREQTKVVTYDGGANINYEDWHHDLEEVTVVDGERTREKAKLYQPLSDIHSAAQPTVPSDC